MPMRLLRARPVAAKTGEQHGISRTTQASAPGSPDGAGDRILPVRRPGFAKGFSRLPFPSSNERHSFSTGCSLLLAYLTLSVQHCALNVPCFLIFRPRTSDSSSIRLSLNEPTFHVVRYARDSFYENAWIEMDQDCLECRRHSAHCLCGHRVVLFAGSYRPAKWLDHDNGASLHFRAQGQYGAVHLPDDVRSANV